MPNSDASFRPKRGRPSAQQVAAIEQAIITTARALFLEEGFDAVSMEAVAATTGVSKGTLYSRHRSKEELFEAVVEESVRQWSEEAARQNHLIGDDIGARLRHHARTIAHFQMQPDVRSFRKLVLTSKDRFPRLSQTLHDAGYLYIVELISADIEATARQDGKPLQDPAFIARLLVNMLTGSDLQEPTDDPDEADRRAIRAVDILLAARSAW